MNDMESMQREEPVDLESVSQSSEVTAGETLDDKLQELSTGGLPYEPAQAEGGREPSDVLRELYNFFLFGNLPEGSAASTDINSLVPALLYQYRDLKNIRHDYPCCIAGTVSAIAVRTLSTIIDDAVDNVSEEGDSGERLKQHIYRIEPEIRALAYQEQSAGLLGLWDRAAKNLLSNSKLSQDKKDQLRDNLAVARQSLADSELITCGQDTAQLLLPGLARIHWQEKCGNLREELDSLIQQLTDLLSVDYNSSAEGKTPDHLRDTTATDDEIDFNTLSSILTSSHLDQALPENRRNRIQSSLDAMLRAKSLFDPNSAEIDTLFDNCSAAIESYNSRMTLMVGLFKAMAITRLELENRYQEDAHDAYFEQFSVKNLDDKELVLCPPVLMSIRCSELRDEDLYALQTILISRMPIKLLLQVDNLFTRDPTSNRSDLIINWPARMAGMIMATGSAFVLQSPVSDLQSLHSGFLAGLGHDGPALFSVYSGNEEDRSGLPGYFDASAAKESRVFPVLKFNPGGGRKLIESLSVLENSQHDRDWPVDTFHYRNSEDAETRTELAFTPADFLLNDNRLADQFWCAAPDYWHENMIPLQDYLTLPVKQSEDNIPYILAVDEAGCLHRVIVTRSMVELAQDCVGNWRRLQEFGGINNSFVARQVEEEKARLEEAKQNEVAAIEDKYKVQMEQDIGKLTEQIVQRIARQLLMEGDAPLLNLDQPVAAAPAPAAPAAAAGQAVEATAEPEQPAVEEEEDEDEGLSLDDPYIDTPLCTSCDDCTKLNAQIFAYDGNKQAYIKDPDGGPFKDLVVAAEKCPVKIIHPGKPRNPDEAGLDDLIKRAAPFN